MPRPRRLSRFTISPLGCSNGQFLPLASFKTPAVLRPLPTSAKASRSPLPRCSNPPSSAYYFVEGKRDREGMAAVAKQGMSPYEAARERTVLENKRKMEALNLRHLSAAIKEAPKTPSPMKQKRRRIIEDAVVVPSPPRRSRRLANLPEVKYAEIAPHNADRMTRSPRKPSDLIYLAHRGNISMKARLEATRKAEDLEAQLDPEFPSFVKAMLHSHVVRGFWLGLPSHFCDTYMPKQDSIVTLVDERGEEFDTNYLAYKKGLSGGWAGFAICHGMQDGDAAVFQLIKPTTFKVHIIRAASDDGSEVDE